MMQSAKGGRERVMTNHNTENKNVTKMMSSGDENKHQQSVITNIFQIYFL
jgi:hypothetical protein